MSIPFRLVTPLRLREEMCSQAQAEFPNECCGLLAGRLEEGVGLVSHRYPLINAAASPVKYLSDGHSMAAAVKDMRPRGLEILAVYHSHPTSEPIPSRTDLRDHAESLWAGSGLVHLIVSLKAAEPVVRGWKLGNDNFDEIELEWV